MQFTSPRRALTAIPLIALLAGAGIDVRARSEREADRIERTCFQPYLLSFERLIQDEYNKAFAVFSGKVRTITAGTVKIVVTRVWKGKLGAEVAMPDGQRDNGDGTITAFGEGFDFVTGEEYLVFGYGTSAESLSTSVCRPNGRLADSKRTIAVLDQVVKRLE